MATTHATLAVQLFSLREDLDKNRAGTLARLAELGYRHVEPFGFGDWRTPAEDRLAKARALRADLDAAGLSVCSLHASIAAGELATLAEECRILGTDTVFIPIPGLVEGFDGGDHFGRDVFGDLDTLTRFAARVDEAATELAGHGIRLGYHNHELEWTTLPDGRHGYDVFWELTGAQVIAELDVYWATVAGQDPAAVLRALDGRVVAAHLKDGKAVRQEPQTPIGTGDVDVPAAIEAGGPTLAWHIAEIDTTELDRFDLLKHNRDALLGLGTSTSRSAI
ncbi:sugar phosphate isomerase/epimerase family protein [Streptomyces sp. NPDC102364]|uniref:sugar phosphate isomerase/epimerase family protein n=1 Tax=Streptomyces sp. NPDC102364 TaxID=3366161 RepID=UPI0037FCAF1E